MSMRDLISRGRGERSSLPASRGEEGNPFFQLHREMNRLFDDVLGRFDAPAIFGRSGTSWPSLEVREADGAVKVAAEIPGMDEKDIEVLLDGDVLTIRGEKKEDVEDQERRFSEHFYGRFERVVRLPFEVEEGKVEASFDKGVLTITLPKSPKAQAKAKRIAVNAASKGKQDSKH